MVKSLLISTFILLFIGPTLLDWADFEARENDSRLYTRFVKQMKSRPMKELIAPEWRNMSPYQDPNNPYVRDHLMGQFIFSTLLAKIGWDARYSHYIVNQLYRLFIPLLAFLIFAHYFSKTDSLVVMIATHLNPMAFNYGMRANQEQPLVFAMLLCVYGYIQLNTQAKIRRGWSFFIFGGVYGFLIKGLVGLIHFPFWLIFIGVMEKDKFKKIGQLAILGFVILATSLIYEGWFRQVTGHSFWEGYFEIQVFGRSSSATTAFSSLGYYLGRTLGYSMPWILGLTLFRKVSIKTDELRLFGLYLFISLGPILVFGYFGRHASRYIFPVYYLISGLGAVLFARFFEKKIAQYRLMKLSPVVLHLVIFWAIFLAQYFTYLYKGKTYIVFFTSLLSTNIS